MHAALTEEGYAEQRVGPIARDATAIAAREQPVPKEKRPEHPRRTRGRPRKGAERPKEPSRLERPRTMPLEKMLQELPKACAVGVKRHAKGYTPSWRGYQLPGMGLTEVFRSAAGCPLRCCMTVRRRCHG